MKHTSERGLVGKMLVFWLIIFAIVVVGVLDFGSITATRFHIADIAGQAAQDGANAYPGGTGAAAQANAQATACAAAQSSLKAADPAIKMVRCSVDPTTKELTLTVRKTAGTIAVQRISFLQKYGKVEDTETAGPSAL